MVDPYGITVESIDGSLDTLDAYRGKVLLVVNVASECGYTSQYKGLESLYQHFKDDGFAVLGFPCNQFGRQEPGSNEAIQTFCELNYGVTFPMFAKVAVNGAGEHPLYEYLKDKARGLLGSRKIKWNFTKFLVGRDGQVKGRYGSRAKPSSLVADIQAALAETPEADE